MTRPLSFRWDPEFVRLIDAARGDVPRSVFVRRAVERALDGAGSSFEGHVSAAVRREFGPAERPGGSAEQPVSRSEMFRRATQR